MALSGSGPANEKRVLAAGDELQRMQLEASVLGQLRVEAPVEFGQRELLVEAGLLIAALDEARAAAVQFILQEKREGLDEGLVGALGLEDASVQRGAHAREAQLFEALFDFRHAYGHCGYSVSD